MVILKGRGRWIFSDTPPAPRGCAPRRLSWPLGARLARARAGPPSAAPLGLGPAPRLAPPRLPVRLAARPLGWGWWVSGPVGGSAVPCPAGRVPRLRRSAWGLVFVPPSFGPPRWVHCRACFRLGRAAFWSRGWAGSSPDVTVLAYIYISLCPSGGSRRDPGCATGPCPQLVVRWPVSW